MCLPPGTRPTATSAASASILWLGKHRGCPSGNRIISDTKSGLWREEFGINTLLKKYCFLVKKYYIREESFGLSVFARRITV